MREYRADWDDKNKTPRKTPLHNWASHGADAAREMAVQLWDVDGEAQKRRQPLALQDYDPYKMGTEQYRRDIEVEDRRRQETAGMDDYRPW
jgi:hypothetical protein